jgi:hypothetical protein
MGLKSQGITRNNKQSRKQKTDYVKTKTQVFFIAKHI